ncbi:MAG: 5'/3'-nucleotidase SurE [Bdellovibrio sp.]|nr:5'/3'-nucleotidase SurE [Bdellovibrio sp.]
MRILISNDDGVHAQGLKALYKELKKLGQVWVVAPLEEKSTTGHSLTIHKPLRLIPMGPNFYGVSGSPADCVYLGIREVIGGMPDLVVSGINRGANLGQDVYYSGTVSAAREACILGIPSLAVSLVVDFKKRKPELDLHYDTAAKVALRVLRNLKSSPLPVHTMLNLNVPDIEMKDLKGVKAVRQGFRFYSGSILRRRDHRGKDYYWVGGQYKGFRKEVDTDCFVVETGYASITPIKLDSTDFSCLKKMEQDGIRGFPK